MNRVTLVGNLTRDIDMRQTQSGMAVMSLGIAVNNRRRNQQTGEWEDEPCFVDCVMFGNRAESVSRFLHKGSKVGIDGKLRYSSWEAKDGSGKRSKLEVLVDDLELLTPRNQDGAQGAQGGNGGGYAYGNGNAPQMPPQQPRGQYQQPQGQYQQQPQIDVASSVYDDDIPF